MAKQNYHTSLVGRKVRLGWSARQMAEWSHQPGNASKGLDVKTIPAKYADVGQKEGTIVGAYIIAGDDEPTYTVEAGGYLMELNARQNFDIIPKEDA